MSRLLEIRFLFSLDENFLFCWASMILKKIISNNDEYKRIGNVIIETSHYNRISIFRYYDGDELYRYISFEFQLTCFVPKTRQPPPLSAGVRCCDDKRSYKPALFFNRTEGSYSCNRWLTTLKEKKLISFFFFSRLYRDVVTLFPFFPGPLSSYEYVFANALSRCAGGTNSGLFHATPLALFLLLSTYYRHVSRSFPRLPSWSVIRSLSFISFRFLFFFTILFHFLSSTSFQM